MWVQVFVIRTLDRWYFNEARSPSMSRRFWLLANYLLMKRGADDTLDFFVNCMGSIYFLLLCTRSELICTTVVNTMRLSSFVTSFGFLVLDWKRRNQNSSLVQLFDRYDVIHRFLWILHVSVILICCIRWVSYHFIKRWLYNESVFHRFYKVEVVNIRFKDGRGSGEGGQPPGESPQQGSPRCPNEGASPGHRSPQPPFSPCECNCINDNSLCSNSIFDHHTLEGTLQLKRTLGDICLNKNRYRAAEVCLVAHPIWLGSRSLFHVLFAQVFIDLIVTYKGECLFDTITSECYPTGYGVAYTCNSLYRDEIIEGMFSFGSPVSPYKSSIISQPHREFITQTVGFTMAVIRYDDEALNSERGERKITHKSLYQSQVESTNEFIQATINNNLGSLDRQQGTGNYGSPMDSVNYKPDDGCHPVYVRCGYIDIECNRSGEWLGNYPRYSYWLQQYPSEKVASAGSSRDKGRLEFSGESDEDEDEIDFVSFDYLLLSNDTRQARCNEMRRDTEQDRGLNLEDKRTMSPFSNAVSDLKARCSSSYKPDFSSPSQPMTSQKKFARRASRKTPRKHELLYIANRFVSTGEQRARAGLIAPHKMDVHNFVINSENPTAEQLRRRHTAIADSIVPNLRPILKLIDVQLVPFDDIATKYPITALEGGGGGGCRSGSAGSCGGSFENGVSFPHYLTPRSSLSGGISESLGHSPSPSPSVQQMTKYRHTGLIYIHGFLTPDYLLPSNLGQFLGSSNLTYDVIPICFSWPRGDMIQEYDTVSQKVSDTRLLDAIIGMLMAVSRFGIDNVDVMTHSMGCRLIINTLERIIDIYGRMPDEISVIRNLILVQPEVHVDGHGAAFNSQQEATASSSTNESEAEPNQWGTGESEGLSFNTNKASFEVVSMKDTLDIHHRRFSGKVDVSNPGGVYNNNDDGINPSEFGNASSSESSVSVSGESVVGGVKSANPVGNLTIASDGGKSNGANGAEGIVSKSNSLTFTEGTEKTVIESTDTVTASTTASLQPSIEAVQPSTSTSKPPPLNKHPPPKATTTSTNQVPKNVRSNLFVEDISFSPPSLQILELKERTEGVEGGKSPPKNVPKGQNVPNLGHCGSEDPINSLPSINNIIESVSQTLTTLGTLSTFINTSTLTPPNTLFGSEIEVEEDSVASERCESEVDLGGVGSPTDPPPINQMSQNTIPISTQNVPNLCPKTQKLGHICVSESDGMGDGDGGDDPITTVCSAFPPQNVPKTPNVPKGPTPTPTFTPRNSNFNYWAKFFDRHTSERSLIYQHYFDTVLTPLLQKTCHKTTIYTDNKDVALWISMIKNGRFTLGRHYYSSWDFNFRYRCRVLPLVATTSTSTSTSAYLATSRNISNNSNSVFGTNSSYPDSNPTNPHLNRHSESNQPNQSIYMPIYSPAPSLSTSTFNSNSTLLFDHMAPTVRHAPPAPGGSTNRAFTSPPIDQSMPKLCTNIDLLGPLGGLGDVDSGSERHEGYGYGYETGTNLRLPISKRVGRRFSFSNIPFNSPPRSCSKLGIRRNISSPSSSHHRRPSSNEIRSPHVSPSHRFAPSHFNPLPLSHTHHIQSSFQRRGRRMSQRKLRAHISAAERVQMPNKSTHNPYALTIVDCTNLETNIHRLRHCYFNANPFVISDISGVVSQQSEENRGLLKVGEAVYTFRSVPKRVGSVLPI